MKNVFKLKMDNIIIGLLVFATLVSGGVLASVRAKADDTTVVDEITVMIPAACSISGNISQGNEHTDTLMPNEYKANIGTTDVKVFCNDFAGFSVYAIGFSGNNNGATNMIGVNTGQTIPTGIDATGSVSNWAMKVIKVNDSTVAYHPENLSIANGYDTYHTVPNTYVKVANYEAASGPSTTDTTLGSKFQTTYAASVSAVQAADTYVGKVKYVLVHPATMVAGTYTVAYNANGGSGTMSSETGLLNYEPHTLTANAFIAPSGYIFNGWCTVQDQTQTPYQTTCGGDSYVDGATLPASSSIAATSGGTLNLYAYWKVPPTINDLSYMQDFATLSSVEKTSVLGSMTTGTQYQLKDSRDQKDYYISKLLDGNVWMTQNLELDLDSAVTAGSVNALTSENTNLKTYGSNGYDSNNGYSCSNASTTSNCTDTGEVITWVPARTTVTELISGENSNFPNTTAANSTSYSYNPGDRYYYPTSATGDTPYTLAECESHNYTDCAHYKAGNYYNWSASVASNNTSSYTGNDTDAGNSVCPKGWRLPKKSANEYQSLVDAYGITASNALNLRNAPLYFVRSGYVNGGSLDYAASVGRYWSSTVSNASRAYYLYFGNGYLYPALSNYRYYGFPVRCVAE